MITSRGRNLRLQILARFCLVGFLLFKFLLLLHDNERVCFLPINSGHQVRWTYQPGSHRRKVTQDFPSTFFLRCVP